MRLLDTINAVQGVATKVANKTTEELDSIKGAMESVVERVDTVAGEVTTMGAKMDSIDLMESVVVRSVENIPSCWDKWAVIGTVMGGIGTAIATFLSWRSLRKSAKIQFLIFCQSEVEQAETEYEDVQNSDNALRVSVQIEQIAFFIDNLRVKCDYGEVEKNFNKMRRDLSNAWKSYKEKIRIYQLLPEKMDVDGVKKDIYIAYNDLWNSLMKIESFVHCLSLIQKHVDVDNSEFKEEFKKALEYGKIDGFSIEDNLAKYKDSDGLWDLDKVKKDSGVYLIQILKDIDLHYEDLCILLNYIIDSELAKRDKAYEALKKASMDGKKMKNKKRWNRK